MILGMPSQAVTEAGGTTRPGTPGRAGRYAYAVLGCVCLAIGAVGAVLPGLPTTIFLLAASWLFTRSCPYLAERLDRSRLGAPLRRFRETRAMPLRAKVVAVAFMWTGIGLAVAFADGIGPRLSTLLAALGLVGSWVILLRIGTLTHAGGDPRPEGTEPGDGEPAEASAG